MLIDKNKYRKSLSDLWNRVFGDDYSFIDLIFNKAYAKSILCFAEIDNDKIVSAFYLIKNELSFDGEIYNGYYLYAAATLPEYRGKGIMSSLIRQSQEYCRKNAIDFISLVPSQESLYSYYSSLEFRKSMYRYVNFGNEASEASYKAEILSSSEQILDLRRRYKGNIINFADDSFGYAFDCMKHSGFEFKKIAEDILLIDSDDYDSFSEIISSDNKAVNEAAEKISFKGGLTSPFELKKFKNNEIMPYGMIYPINAKLVRDWNITDIYMNIALD